MTFSARCLPLSLAILCYSNHFALYAPLYVIFHTEVYHFPRVRVSVPFWILLLMPYLVALPVSVVDAMPFSLFVPLCHWRNEVLEKDDCF